MSHSSSFRRKFSAFGKYVLLFSMLATRQLRSIAQNFNQDEQSSRQVLIQSLTALGGTDTFLQASAVTFDVTEETTGIVRRKGSWVSDYGKLKFQRRFDSQQDVILNSNALNGIKHVKSTNTRPTVLRSEGKITELIEQSPGHALLRLLQTHDCHTRKATNNEVIHVMHLGSPGVEGIWGVCSSTKTESDGPWLWLFSKDTFIPLAIWEPHLEGGNMVMFESYQHTSIGLALQRIRLIPFSGPQMIYQYSPFVQIDPATIVWSSERQ